jgi:cytochrome c5
MSNAQQHSAHGAHGAHGADDSHEVHEGPIKTPKQLIAAVIASFVIPIIVIIMLANYVSADKRPAAGTLIDDEQAVARRLQPVGKVEVRDASDTAALKTGEQVYTAQCAACHAAGVAGAPKFGDGAAWAARIKTGYESLLNSSLKGKGAMGAQGGGDHSNFEIARAVVYMANQGGAKFEEPKAPAAAQSAAATTATPAAVVAPAAAAVPVPAVASVAAATATATAAVATVAPAAKADAKPALYAVCGACHEAGVAGAPKLGDKDAWASRTGGVDGLSASVIKGKGAMPPRGGSAGTDDEIKAVVAYMLSSVK